VVDNDEGGMPVGILVLDLKFEYIALLQRFLSVKHEVGDAVPVLAGGRYGYAVLIEPGSIGLLSVVGNDDDHLLAHALRYGVGSGAAFFDAFLIEGIFESFVRAVQQAMTGVLGRAVLSLRQFEVVYQCIQTKRLNICVVRITATTNFVNSWETIPTVWLRYALPSSKVTQTALS
jgi:hypothetical protein